MTQYTYTHKRTGNKDERKQITASHLGLNHHENLSDECACEVAHGTLGPLDIKNIQKARDLLTHNNFTAGEVSFQTADSALGWFKNTGRISLDASHDSNGEAISEANPYGEQDIQNERLVVTEDSFYITSEPRFLDGLQQRSSSQCFSVLDAKTYHYDIDS